MTQPIHMRAAIARGPNRGVEILDVQLDPPRAGEVLVRIRAAGVCASDLHVVDGNLPQPFPIVLGHEAAGEIVQVGPGVEALRPGQRVVLSITPFCGDCAACRRGRPSFCELAARQAATGCLADGTSRLRATDEVLHHFNSTSAFAEYAVVPESGAVPIAGDVPIEVAALVSCGVLTGYGAARNAAGLRGGESVAVWGCGGVGLNIVQGARIAGADPIVAVDVVPEKLALARRLGATHAVHANETDPVEAVRGIAAGGVDVAFEALGRERTIQQAWAAAGVGGTVIVVGIMPKGATLTIDPWELVSEKGIRGCYFGSGRPHRDVPRIIDHYRAGELALDELVAHTISLDELPGAFERLRAGDGARSVIVFD